MKVIRWLDAYLEECLLALLLIGIASVMTVQVFCRYVLNSPLSWSDELTRYFLVWSCFLSVSFCVKKRISIKIDQVQNAFPRRFIPWVKMLRHTIVLCFCLVMLPFAVTYARQSAASGAVSPALGIPMVCLQSAPLACFLLLAVRVAQAWVREFRASREALRESAEDLIHPPADGEPDERPIPGVPVEVNEPERVREIITDNTPDRTGGTDGREGARRP